MQVVDGHAVMDVVVNIGLLEGGEVGGESEPPNSIMKR